jgi:hypothetical protein
MSPNSPDSGLRGADHCGGSGSDGCRFPTQCPRAALPGFLWSFMAVERDEFGLVASS